MTDLEKKIVDNEEISKIVKEIKKDKYKSASVKELIKDYPDKHEKLEKASLEYMGGKDLKILKTEFPDKRKYLTKKVAYSYEFFNCFEDYQKSVDNIKKEDFFSKIKVNVMMIKR